jgi:hypothetical protein
LTGTDTKENKGEISAGEEFPGDFSGLIALMTIPNFGDGSILRFKDVGIRMHGYTFVGEGDILNRLTFVVIKDVGYVYLRGKGKVISPEGVTTKLGY